MPEALITPFRKSERDVMSGFAINCPNCGTVALRQYQAEWVLSQDHDICPFCSSPAEIKSTDPYVVII